MDRDKVDLFLTLLAGLPFQPAASALLVTSQPHATVISDALDCSGHVNPTHLDWRLLLLLLGADTHLELIMISSTATIPTESPAKRPRLGIPDLGLCKASSQPKDSTFALLGKSPATRCKKVPLPPHLLLHCRDLAARKMRDLGCADGQPREPN